MSLMEKLQERARVKNARVVYPEANEHKIVEAAAEVQKLGIARPILIGDKDIIAGFGIDTSHMTILDMATSPKAKEYAATYASQEGFPQSAIERALRDPLNLGAIMVRMGDADCLVAGLVNATESVILSSSMYIGLAAGVETPSSFFIMEIPGWDGGENGLIAFADCAVVTNPSSEQLAGIALSTASSVKALLEWVPRVAMLSFSTKGSATHPDVDKVTRALEIVKKERPDLLIDGELQVDSAIVPAVSEKKIKGENVLQGRANILVFPDLDAGNAGYKLVQRLAKAEAYGPVLQGFAKPVSDLSRGATVRDIVGATTLVAAQV